MKYNINRKKNGTATRRKTKAEQTQRVDEDSPKKLSADAFKRTFDTALFSRMTTVVDNIKMSRLRDIFGGAQSGQLGELFDVYLKMESSDARLQSLSNSRRMAATRASHVITAGDDKNKKSEAAAQLVEQNISRLNWEKILRSLLDGRMYGATIFENVWKQVGGDLMISKVNQLDHTRLEQWKLDENDPRYGQLAVLTGEYGQDRQFVSDFPEYKLITATNTTKTGYYDIAGVFRSVARWYVLKTFAIKAWAQYAEVYGFPVPIVTVDQDKYEENKSLIKQLLTSVGVNRYGIFFEGMEYELESASDNASIEVFEKYIDLCNTEMAIAILGQNLTTEVSGGSRAAAQTHLDIMENIIQDDVDWIDEIIQAQFVDPLVRVNFPSLPLEMYPTYKSVLDKKVDLQKIGAGLKQMSKLIEIPVNYIHEVTQIPKPDDGDETIGGFQSGSNPLVDAINGDSN